MQRTTIALVVPAFFASMLVPACFGGVPTAKELCAEQCSCAGCTPNEEQVCVTAHESLRRLSARTGCSQAYDDYIACLSAQECRAGAIDQGPCREQRADYESCGDSSLPDIGGYL
ncbi:MAG TPA: hypothetical protein VHB21_20300 [Minicystis sp.]|nr:hypothetical protein [Minicystis sp.]